MTKLVRVSDDFMGLVGARSPNGAAVLSVKFNEVGKAVVIGTGDIEEVYEATVTMTIDGNFLFPISAVEAVASATKKLVESEVR